MAFGGVVYVVHDEALKNENRAWVRTASGMLGPIKRTADETSHAGSGAYAMLAMLLAAAGIYGVISYSVAERAREIGIRMALGAQASDVMKLVTVQGMRLALIGLALGLLVSLALTRLLKSLLFGVSATDPEVISKVEKIANLGVKSGIPS